MAGADLGDPDAQMDLHPVLLEPACGVGVRAVGEPVQHDMAEIDHVHLGQLDRDVAVEVRMMLRTSSASAPEVSTPVGPAPTTTKFSAPLSR